MQPNTSRLLNHPLTPPVLLLACCLLVYAPALSPFFVWDDITLLQGRPLRDGFTGLLRLWSDPAAMPGEEHYWPVVYTAFWLQARLWGGFESAVGYHLVNVLVHAVNCWLIVGLLQRLKLDRMTSFLTGLLFAVHPVHTESVAWVIELKDLLSAFFYLTAALAALIYVDGSRARWLVLTLLLFAAGMLTKTIVVSLPVALALVFWWRTGRIARLEMKVIVPLLLLGGALALFDLATAAAARTAEFPMPLLQRLYVVGRAVWFYLGKLLWPTPLLPVYPRWTLPDTIGEALFPLLMLAALLLALWSLRHRIGRGPLAAGLFFFLTLAPILGLIRFSFMNHSYVADRFQYLASLGPLALAGYALARFIHTAPSPRQTALRSSMTALVCVILAIATWRQAGLWQGPIPLFEHNVRHNPEAWLAHQMLGYEYGQQREWVKAAAHFKRVAELQPTDPMNLRNLAFALSMQGKRDEAMRRIGEALVLDPGNAQTLALRDKLTQSQLSADVGGTTGTGTRR